MADSMKVFDFERFEILKSQQAEAAAEFLNSKFPQGSDARELVHVMEDAGAKCEFAHDRGYFHFCKYVRPGHGIMALVSSIEWQVAIYTGPDGAIVERLVVGRGATGS